MQAQWIKAKVAWVHRCFTSPSPERGERGVGYIVIYFDFTKVVWK